MLTDEHWDKIIDAVNVLSRQQGLVTDLEKVLLFKEHWALFSVEKDLDAFLQGEKLPQLQEQRIRQEAELVRIDAEIKKLQGR